VTQVTRFGYRAMLHLLGKPKDMRKKTWFKFLVVCLACLGAAVVIGLIIELFKN
jgi:hypothetical protein